MIKSRAIGIQMKLFELIAFSVLFKLAVKIINIILELFQVLYMMHVLMIVFDMLIYRFTNLKSVVKVRAHQT